MKKSFLKSMLGRIVIGTLLLLTSPLLLVIFILKFIFTPFGMGRMRFGTMHNWNHPTRFAEKIRNMTDEQFDEFKTKAQNKFHRRACFQS